MSWKRDSQYWKGRLETEKPEIYVRMVKGEIASVRAAAIEAGFIRERTALMDLHRAWKKASGAERKEFLKDVG